MSADAPPGSGAVTLPIPSLSIVDIDLRQPRQRLYDRLPVNTAIGHFQVTARENRQPTIEYPQPQRTRARIDDEAAQAERTALRRRFDRVRVSQLRRILGLAPTGAAIGVLSVVLALRPESSAQARKPPTARSAPRGGRRGLLVLTAGPVVYSYSAVSSGQPETRKVAEALVARGQLRGGKAMAAGGVGVLRAHEPRTAPAYQHYASCLTIDAPARRRLAEARSARTSLCLAMVKAWC